MDATTADGSINIDTRINTDELLSGIAQINESLKGIESNLEAFSKQAEESTKSTDELGKSQKNSAKNAEVLRKQTEGVNKVVQNFKKELKAGKVSMTDFASAFNMINAAANIAGKAISKCITFLKDSTEAYRVQRNAENALAQAAKNNPYLTGEAVEGLKQFASQLQSTSEIGDEVSIGMMTQLAAAGRTQEQIMQIMQTAADIAASGAMSMESAVKNLNKTFSGLSGELGESVPQIKALTAEELKNGKAVEVMAKQYKGMAKATANVEVQLSNAWGDFKEIIGKDWQEKTAPIKAFFLDVLEKINAAKSAAQITKDDAKKLEMVDSLDNSAEAVLSRIETNEKELERYKKDFENAEKDAERKKNKKAGLTADNLRQKAQKGIEETNAEIEKLKIKYADFVKKSNSAADSLVFSRKIKEEQQAIKDLQSQIEDLTKNPDNPMYMGVDAQELIKASKESIEAHQKEIERLTKKKEKLLAIEKEAEKLKQEQAQAAEKSAKAQQSNDYIAENIKAREKQLELLRLEAHAKGEEVKQGDVYKVYLNSYIDLIAKSNDTINEASEVSQKRREEIKKLEEAAKDETDAEKKLQKALELTNEFMTSLGEIKIKHSAADKLKDELLEIEKIQERLNAKNDDGSYKVSDKTIESSQTGDKKRSREELIKGLEAAKVKAAKEALAEITNVEDDYYTQYKKKRNELAELKKELNQQEIDEHSELARTLNQIDKEMAESRIELLKHSFEEISNMSNQLQQIATETSKLMTQQAKDRETIELAALEDEYQKGGMLEEDFAKKKKEIRRKAAEDEYKMAMFEWTTKIATATASAALAVVTALNEGDPYTKIPRAIAAGTLGAIQLAAIIASKPKPPAFATGGIVPGTRGTGDSVTARLTPREIVMNERQQQGLWNFINGGSQGNGLNLTINNSQADKVRANARQSENEITIDILDAHINKGFADGTYDKGYSGMEVRKKGVRYL